MAGEGTINPALEKTIRQAARRDTLGHAIIFSGQGDLIAATRFTAAALECEEAERPCGNCLACRKVARGIHPDVRVVDDPDHKNLAIQVIREVCAEAYFLPNEGRRKIFIFPDCARLEPRAQNVLLKILEEGPPQATFLFCAENSSILLPTIRSRAALWRLSEEPDAAAESRDEEAETLCRLLEKGKEAELLAFCIALEDKKPDRLTLQALCSHARDLAVQGLAACYREEGADAFSRQLARFGFRRLNQAAEVFGQFARQCGYNIGIGHLAGALAASLCTTI